jgi:hypothetical protein
MLALLINYVRSQAITPNSSFHDVFYINSSVIEAQLQ